LTKQNLALVILAAGEGTRMASARPKVMHAIAGRPMIGHVAAAAATLDPERAIAVVAPGMDAVVEAAAAYLGTLDVVLQNNRLGTGDAARTALAALDGFDGDVMVICGDVPLITAASLERLLRVHRGGSASAVTVLAMRPADPSGYGRLIVSGAGALDAIVEDRDADPEQRVLGLCNSGIIALKAAAMPDLLADLRADNATGEYYLTDAVAAARARGMACAFAEAPADELIGVNSLADLALAEAAMQTRLRRRALEGGAALTAPETVFLSADTDIARDATVEPYVVFGPGVSVGQGAVVRAFSHVEGARIEAGAAVGPFSRLRAGTEVGPGARVGNFVEIKNTRLGEGAKANHLSYLGDAAIGARANIGAGTITCNYDGVTKSHTEIGEDAFIGSNTALVAPLAVGARAFVGAGSAINRDVPEDALGIARGRQKNVPGWAKRKRGDR
jgi:bifunctional UDP-N-acetylglucosamine pyrophosphorylase/glucosamine-1-phosphate N-acetyltransferase